MKRTGMSAWVFLVCLVCAAAAQGQLPVGAEPESPRGIQVPLGGMAEARVLRLVKFTGELRDAMGRPRTGVLGVTFALYEQQEGGAARWLETQNVELDEQGRYSILLGVTRSEGLPLELFAEGQARWLGIQVENEAEEPRVLLVSVPYALKAADADTLGGRPPSAFVLAEPEAQAGSAAGGTSSQSPSTIASGQRIVSQIAAASVTGSGTNNMLTKWLDGTAGTLTDSAVIEVGGKVGIGTAYPAFPLDVSKDVPANFPMHFGNAAGYGLNLGSFQEDTIVRLQGTQVGVGNDVNLILQDAGGKVGIGTTYPAFLLHVAKDIPGNFAAHFGNAAGYGLNLGTFQGDTVARIQATQVGVGNNVNLALQAGGGNVGIGTEAPAEKLDVVGNLQVSGSILNSSGTITGGFGSFLGSTTGAIISATQSNASGRAGDFWNSAGGMILTGRTGSGGTTVFSVDGSGNVVGGQGHFSGSTVGGLSSYILTVTQNLGGSAILGSTASDGGGVGVRGLATSPTGITRGVYGEAASTDGRGVVGLATATSGTTFGVLASVDSTDGRGVQGQALATSGSTVGVKGVVSSASGTAGEFWNTTDGFILTARAGSGGTTVFSVDGEGSVLVNGNITTQVISAVNVSDNYLAGHFQASGENSIGVRGIATNASGTGVSGIVTNTSGTGVLGDATASSGSTIGVQGKAASASGKAGDFWNTNSSGMILTGRTGSGGTQVFSVSGTGTVQAAGYLTAGSSSLATRAITYLAGCDSCSVLADADDQRTIYANLIGAMTINSVTCFSDAGAPTINIQRDDGTPANILSSDLSCSTAGASSTTFSGVEDMLALNDKLDFVMVTAGGTAKRATVVIKATLN